MRISSSRKTPQTILRGFVICLTLLATVSCGAGKLETWGKDRFEVKYDATVFIPVMNYENDLSLKFVDGDKEVVVVSAIVPAQIDKNVTRDDYFETAKNDFESKFSKVLNNATNKSELQGISTYTENVTALAEGSEKTVSGILKFMMMDDAIMVVSVIDDAETMKKHTVAVTQLIDSAILKGAK